MEGRLQRIPSRAMGRPVFLWSYGWWGTPVLALPTAGGMAHDWQHNGAIEALAPLIRAGRIKLYCPETNVAECWTHAEGPATRRLARHRAYEEFVVGELVPWIRQDCNLPNARIAVAGPSVGGWYAVNFALKYPEVFWWALSMSGRFAMDKLVDGGWPTELYHQLPFWYVPNLGGAELERVRRQTSITLVVGQGPHEGDCLPETVALARTLRERGISCDLDVWGHDSGHQWPWWHRQIKHHLLRRA